MRSGAHEARVQCSRPRLYEHRLGAVVHRCTPATARSPARARPCRQPQGAGRSTDRRSQTAEGWRGGATAEAGRAVQLCSLVHSCTLPTASLRVAGPAYGGDAAPWILARQGCGPTPTVIRVQVCTAAQQRPMGVVAWTREGRHERTFPVEVCHRFLGAGRHRVVRLWPRSVRSRPRPSISTGLWDARHGIPRELKHRGQPAAWGT